MLSSKSFAVVISAEKVVVVIVVPEKAAALAARSKTNAGSSVKSRGPHQCRTHGAHVAQPSSCGDVGNATHAHGKLRDAQHSPRNHPGCFV